MVPQFPIIVIEGPDGSGKTTLAEALCEELGAKYVHATYRFKDRMCLYHAAIIRRAWKQAQHCPVVIDRLWPSEIAYGNVFRQGSVYPQTGPESIQFLDLMLRSVRASYVFCIPKSKKKYIDEFNNLKTIREEMYEFMEPVYDQYQDIFHRLDVMNRPDIHRYDRFTDGLYLDEYVQQTLQNAFDHIIGD